MPGVVSLLKFVVETMLESMQAPADYDGPKLEFLVRDLKQDNT